MHQAIPRRVFLKSCTLSAGAMALASWPAQGLEPFQRAGSPRLRLSLAAYSFREFFSEGNQRRGRPLPADRRLDLFQFIDFCSEHGCQGAELTSYYFPPNVTEEFLLKVRRHAFLRGMEVSGTAVGNNFAVAAGRKRDEQIALVKRWVDYASVLGAPHVRIFAGSAEGVPAVEAQQLCISAIEECADYSGRKGVFLGLENHGGIVAEASGLLAIIRAVKSPWAGVNLDTGNFHTDDPYGELARCAPYAVNVQVKTEIQRRGQKKEPADLARVVKILREANYQGYVALEYEAAEDPWTAVPRSLRQLERLLNEPSKG